MVLNKNIFIALILLFVGTSFSYAQGNLETGEVEVIKDFDARLKDTEKISVTPTLPNQEAVTKTQTYNIPPRTLTVDYLPPKIRPIAMRGDKLPEAYNGYVKLGGGIPTTTFGELAYHTFLSLIHI